MISPIYFLIASIFLLPNFSLAAGIQCSPSGYTVATINGIFTDENGARRNLYALADKTGESYQGQVIDFQYLLNPPHLGGLGDILKSIYQGLFDKETVTDYDLVEMLKSASEKVKTQKILLVAHSQGNFYANSFYDTVAGHTGGVPAESISVYSVATPSGRVAGGGKWMTSDTDKVIAQIVGRALSRPIMSPNTHITLQPDDDSLGHDFSKIYLKYRGPEMVADIESSLNRLQTNNVQDAQKPCLAPPPLTLGHQMEGAIFAVADPIASSGGSAMTAAATSIYDAGAAAVHVAANIYNFAGMTLAQRIAAFQHFSFGAAAALYGSSVTQKDLTDETRTPTQSSTQTQTDSPRPQKTEELGTALDTTTAADDPARVSNAPSPAGDRALLSRSPELSKSSAEKGLVASARISRDTSPDLPFAGSGSPSQSQIAAAVAAAAAQSSPSPSSSSTSSSTVTTTDTTPPDPPIITAPSSDGAVSTSTTLTFTGTAEASSMISNNATSATTTADTSGNWTLGLTGLAQGTSTIQFFAQDTARNISLGSSRTVFIDSVAPSFSLTVSECASSLAISGCLVATTTLTLSWLSSADDLSYYSVTCETNGGACVNFSFASTTATSTIYTVPTDNAAYAFKATATDIHGITSSQQTSEVTIATRPVVINEIAWAGTGSSATTTRDEWMELYNHTDTAISLTGWVLAAADNTPYIPLSGAIPAHGYFILERADDDAITDVSAHFIYGNDGPAWALNNSGEQLTLSHASATIDKTPAPCGFFWCFGTGYRTMERYDPLASGTDMTNWSSYAGMLGNGKNADNAAIEGTPGKRNSIDYFIDPSGSNLFQSKTLSKTKNPYVIPDTTLTIQSGTTLTLDPGVVIKFHNVSSALVVNGAVNAAGTTAEPVIFTSFHDDDCGITGGCGDTDEATTSPAAGDWKNISFKNSSTASTLTHAIIRYGGMKPPFNVNGAVRVVNSSVELQNTTIENNYAVGLWLENSTSTVITDSTIQNHREPDPGSYGIFMIHSSPSIKNTLFKNNASAIYDGGGSSVVNLGGITFDANTTDDSPATLIP